VIESERYVRSPLKQIISRNVRMTLAPAIFVAFLIENSVIKFVIFVVDFTLKVLLSLGDVVLVKQHSTKDQGTFLYSMRLYFRNSD
jgi:hypothetical protein